MEHRTYVSLASWAARRVSQASEDAMNDTSEPEALVVNSVGIEAEKESELVSIEENRAA